MNKPHAIPVATLEIEDVSGGHVFSTRWPGARGGDATKVARRGARDLEHAPTQVMPPPPKLAKLPVGKVPHKNKRGARTGDARPADVEVDSRYDIEPPVAAHAADDDDDRETEIWARPAARRDAAWASAPTRSMAAVWRDAALALESEADTAPAPAPTTDASLTVAQPRALTPSGNARTAWRGRARGRSGALVCALAIWLADVPLLDDGLAWGAHAAAVSQRAATDGLSRLEELGGRARTVLVVAQRVRDHVR